MEEELVWWPLICPLTDGTNAAMYGLMQQLLAAWHWTVKTSNLVICLPAPMVLNSRQFLDEDNEGHGWGVQH